MSTTDEDATSLEISASSSELSAVDLVNDSNGNIPAYVYVDLPSSFPICSICANRSIRSHGNRHRTRHNMYSQPYDSPFVWNNDSRIVCAPNAYLSNLLLSEKIESLNKIVINHKSCIRPGTGCGLLIGLLAIGCVFLILGLINHFNSRDVSKKPGGDERFSKWPMGSPLFAGGIVMIVCSVILLPIFVVYLCILSHNLAQGLIKGCAKITSQLSASRVTFTLIYGKDFLNTYYTTRIERATPFNGEHRGYCLLRIIDYKFPVSPEAHTLVRMGRPLRRDGAIPALVTVYGTEMGYSHSQYHRESDRSLIAAGVVVTAE